MSNQMPEQPMECVWLTDDCACELLRSCPCRGMSCSFRRTAAQNTMAAANWKSRIASLPEDQQRRIAKKYYGGNMPWK